MGRMQIQSVILAGGSGTRLWPASRQNYPKQLLTLTGANSMLQETALRLRGLTGAEVSDDPIVVTNEEYRFLAADQLREAGIEKGRVVLEPVGRNTAPALTLAALLLLQTGSDPLMLVMPSDHIIADLAAFHRAIMEAAAQAEAGKIVTFGIVPDRPETGYGYLRMGEPIAGAPTARALDGFTEKPDAETAAALLAGGAHLWNSGIFLVKRSVWLAALERHRPDIAAACKKAIEQADSDGTFIRPEAEAFAASPADSIDYAVMERLDGSDGITGVVIPLSAGWSDVGAWDALWSVSPKDVHGNVIRGEVVADDTEDSLVFAESRLVATLGCRDIVIVETADAVLVADRHRTDDLKRLVTQVENAHEGLVHDSSTVHRPWGTFSNLEEGAGFKVKHIVVKPGAKLSLQLHNHRAEHWVVVQGVARVTCGDRQFDLAQNESTYLPQGEAHRLENLGTELLDIIEVQSGDYLGEDDIVRLEDHYGRT